MQLGTRRPSEDGIVLKLATGMAVYASRLVLLLGPRPSPIGGRTVSTDCITLRCPNSCCGRALARMHLDVTATVRPHYQTGHGARLSQLESRRRCCPLSLRSRPDHPAVADAVAVVFVVRPQWPLVREGLALEAEPLLARRPVRREEMPGPLGTGFSRKGATTLPV